jgi:hypothetical protein
MSALFRKSRTASVLMGVTCLSAALVLTASGNAATSSARPVNALILGKVFVCGAIPGGPGGRPPCRLDRRATVSAFNANHRLVATESITNGHFSFALGAGTYTLRSRRGGYRATRRVTAQAKRTVHTSLRFQSK